jgi:aromatic-L-amino-acid decarboxylase
MNKQLLENINKTGKTLLTHTKLKGKYVIRFCIGQRTTQERHVIDTWKLITKETEKMLEQ